MADITMVKCPMCEIEWIDSEYNLVCNKCKPALEIDLAVADITRAVGTLETHEASDVRARIGILVNLYSRLDALIQKAW